MHPFGYGLIAYIFAIEGKQGETGTTSLFSFSSEKSVTMYASFWV